MVIAKVCITHIPHVLTSIKTFFQLGVTLSGESKKCRLTTTPYQIKYLNSRELLKPGLPWKTTVIPIFSL